MSEEWKYLLVFIATVSMTLLHGPGLLGEISSYHSTPLKFEGVIKSCNEDKYSQGGKGTGGHFIRLLNINIDDQVYGYQIPGGLDRQSTLLTTYRAIKTLCKNNNHIDGTYIKVPAGLWGTRYRVYSLNQISTKANKLSIEYLKRSIDYYSAMFIVLLLSYSLIYSFSKLLSLNSSPVVNRANSNPTRTKRNGKTRKKKGKDKRKKK